MRNVLVLIHPDEGQESRLQAALSITRAVSGHLTCLDVFVMPVVVAEPWTGYADTAVVTEAMDQDTANRGRIEQRLSKEDVAWTMLSTTGLPGYALREAAEFADLIVVSTHGSQESAIVERSVVAEVVTKSGRPVLVVPPASESFDLSGKVLIAWDGSHEANQALRAAVPLLGLAGEVTILIVNDTEGPFPAEDAATYLSRHGIVVNVLERKTRDLVAHTILEQARIGEASYIVMGAFGPGRVIETVFGGVTRSVVKESAVPILMAH